MRPPLLYLLLLLLGVIACQADKKVPSDILPPDRMQEVLWDMMRADQFVVSFMLSKDSTLRKNQERIKWYNRVLAIHEISEKEFKESFHYYQTRPDLMATIMDSIARKEEKIDKMPDRKPVKLAE
ncbi:MAG: DUF4296 domain-containing protein [Sphingomonadales bacterium]